MPPDDDFDFSIGPIRHGMIREEEILRILADNLGYEIVDLIRLESEGAVTPELLAGIPADHAARWRVFPARMTEDTLWVALADPLNIDVTDTLERLSGKRVIPVIEREAVIEIMVHKYYGEPPSD